MTPSGMLARAAAAGQGTAAQDGPQTVAGLDALRAQRSELLGQQHALTSRRAELVAQDRFASGDQSRLLKDQVQSLDQRSAQIDAQVARINEQISAAIGRGVGVRGEPGAQGDQGVQGAQIRPGAPVIAPMPRISIPPFSLQTGPSAREVAGLLVGEAVVFLLVGLVLWQLGWRRMRTQMARVIGDQSSRLHELQQAVDVIGVEVERISEGQRYVAKVLTDGTPSPVAGRSAEPVPSSRDRA